MRRISYTPTVLVVLIILMACASLQAVDADARLIPGGKFTHSFPDLPLTLAGDVPSMQVVLPSDYSENRLFPLHLWLGGGGGGSGLARPDLYGGRRYVFIGLPLFHAEGNRKEVHVMYKDAGSIWAAYQVMLERLVQTIPNILLRKGVAQGFSNGGHAISILLSNPETQRGMMGYFRSFVLWESIYMLKPTPGMAGHPLLVMAGDQSLAKPGSWAGGFDGAPRGSAMELVKELGAARIPAELIVMKNTGHACPKEFLGAMIGWVDSKANRSVAEGIKESRRLIAGKLWAEALDELYWLEGGALAETEATEVAGMLHVINERAGKDFTALTAKPATSENARKARVKALEKFADTYPGTALARKAVVMCKGLADVKR